MAHAARTPEKKWWAPFLEAFAETGLVTEACKRAGIARRTAYDARQRDEDFALMWAEVEEAATERLEREAYRRAAEGVKRAIYHQGNVVGEELQFSDTLLIFLLKARRPDIYRERLDVTHAGQVTHRLEAPEDARQRAEEAARILKGAELELLPPANGNGNGHH